MIEFLNEGVRTEFHKLPLDRQRELQETAKRFFARGFLMKIFYVEQFDAGKCEIVVRFEQHFLDPNAPDFA